MAEEAAEQQTAAPVAENSENTQLQQDASGGSPYDVKVQDNPYEVPQAMGAGEEFALDPSLEVTDEMKAMMKEEAVAAQLNAGQAGTYMSKVLSKIAAKNKEAYRQQDAALREAWGADFQRKAGETSKFIGTVAHRSGWTPEMVNFVKSPMGFRMMNDIMKVTGELNAGAVGAGSRGSGQARAPLTEAERKAQRMDMLQNPNNPYYKGLVDPSAPPDVRRAAEKAFNDTFENIKPFG